MNKKYQRILFHISTLFVLIIHGDLNYSIPLESNEKSLLISLNSTLTSSYAFKNWNLLSHPCYWSGIECDCTLLSSSFNCDSFSSSSNNHVYKLDLHGQYVSGTIPSEISLLSKLRHLFLQYNLFEGSIPSEIGLLKNLEIILFNDNMFSSSLPLEISNIQNIIEINLSSNLLEGSIPNQWCQLIQLTTTITVTPSPSPSSLSSSSSI
eukprot:c21810_g6_i1.p1 GENE.c21810_g6_i1~~c21810_g6_i1.p1  ORF type:complete len:208 (+),score=75.42 c21810_g6_i1:17-640(+)